MKKNILFLSCFLVFCAFLAYWSSCATSSASKVSVKKDLVLFDFETDFDEKTVFPQDAVFKLIAGADGNALHVTNGTDHIEPGVKLLAAADKPWNLKGYHQVKADVTNAGDEEIQVEMFVGNDPDGLKRWYCSDYMDLLPGESKTITVDLAWTPWVHEPQLDIVGMRGAPGKLKTDIAAIQEITFRSRYATSENDFLIDNVRATGQLTTRDTTDFFPFIDEFGQHVHSDWNNKIHKREDLKTMREKEQKDIAANVEPKNRNQYGGWTAGPKSEATGWFRTEKRDGKWWMIDPEGRLFWTVGMNCMASNAGISGTEGREHYFADLPTKDDPELGQFYDKGRWASHGFYQDKVPYDAYQFYQANLYKKYGDTWLSDFQNNIHTRLRSWGFNTIGFVSDNGATQMQKTPYVGSIWIRDTPKIEGSQGFWGKFHDVFDPNFRLTVRKSVESQKEGANDPWCIGYFVDNEMSWGKSGSLAEGTLRSPANQPAKIEFVNDLKAKYKSINNLNRKWNTNHLSWEAFAHDTTTPDRAAAEEDLHAFYSKIARTYFRIVNEELKRVAPNQLYLGCRFAWANNEATLTAAAEYLDIVSFNKYEYSVANVALPAGVDKPIMIGEFHFGALDRGAFHKGVKAAESQEQRGEMYRDYIKSALDNPAIVGAHWFQYMDEAPTGREDGENYNVGFINNCDTPYEELIDSARAVNYGLFEYRLNNKIQTKSAAVNLRTVK